MAEAAYDASNIFAKILRGEIPSHRIYEDDAVVAFMDVMPQGPGHTLVVPKAPSRNLLDADPATLGALFVIVRKMALAVKITSLTGSVLRISSSIRFVLRIVVPFVSVGALEAADIHTVLR